MLHLEQQLFLKLEEKFVIPSGSTDLGVAGSREEAHGSLRSSTSLGMTE